MTKQGVQQHHGWRLGDKPLPLFFLSLLPYNSPVLKWLCTTSSRSCNEDTTSARCTLSKGLWLSSLNITVKESHNGLGFEKTPLFRLYLCIKTLTFQNSNSDFRTYTANPDNWFVVPLHFLRGFFSSGAFHISEPSKLTEAIFSCNMKMHFERFLWSCDEFLSFSSSKSTGWEMN